MTSLEGVLRTGPGLPTPVGSRRLRRRSTRRVSPGPTRRPRPRATVLTRRVRPRTTAACFRWKLPGDGPHRAGDGPRRPGQAPAWPLVSDRSVRRGSRVKRDFACTFTGHFSALLVGLWSQSRLRLEGRTRTLSGPSPDLSPTRTLARSAVIRFRPGKMDDFLHLPRSRPGAPL